MLGALIGDMVGSRFEWHNYKARDFEFCHADCRATDDSVLTIATAQALLDHIPFGEAYRSNYRRYPNAGYGRSFAAWAQGESPGGYNSFGNGSAMRAGPVGWYGSTLDKVMELARQSALPTHNHPEGIRGAQAVASAVFLARHGKGKDQIKRAVEQHFGYALDLTPDQIRPGYQFDVTCQGSVPQALSCFLYSSDFEDAIRTAVSIGGDSDTIACICGTIAEASYGGISEPLVSWCLAKLDVFQRQLVKRFRHEVMGIAAAD
jgi:ADP-ribosylglycohydrolase